MEIKDLVKMEHEGQAVLTSAQIAELYECRPDNISNNFTRNRAQFQEGVHYFKLEGGNLREFKRLSSQRGLPISPSASVLYLWTEAGCLYHCKLINTQSAWQVFGELVRVYFAAKGAPLDAVQVTERKKPADLACVYGMLMSDNNVKIGHTGDIPDRLQRVKRETKLDVLKEHHSDFMPRDDARRIEKTLHRRFAQMRVRGEFFNVDFERVVEAIDSVEINVYEETESVPDYRRVELMIELLHAPLDSPLKEKLFMETANLLLDRNIF